MPKAKDKKLTDQDKFKKVKKDIREKMLEILKMVDMEERFTIALRDKQPIATLSLISKKQPKSF